MRVFIMSRNRPFKQTTWEGLPLELQKETMHVVWPEDRDLYQGEGYTTLTVDRDVERTIGNKRQWLIDRYDGPICMLDDDLTFYTRRTDEPAKFREPTTNDIREMFYRLGQLCHDGYVHGGVAMREGGNRVVDGERMVGRCLRAHVVHAGELTNLGVRYDRLPCMEDFDVTLQLLRMGRPNLILNKWVQNQSGSNKEGGCAEYRTPAVQTAAAYALHDLHPDYVTVVEKTTKGAWGGGRRTDVRIQWARAYKESRVGTMG